MRTLVILSIMLIAGCSRNSSTKTRSVIPTEQVPTVVMKAAQAKEPQVKFNKVIKTPDGIYEVQGKNGSGKIIEVEVSEAGKVLKVE